MAQPTQQIGQCSPQLDAVANQEQGWGGGLAAPGLPTAYPTAEAPESLAHEYEDASDFSFRDRRANFHALSWQGGLGPYNPNPPMAAHVETPMAATQVTPINQFNPVPRS